MMIDVLSLLCIFPAVVRHHAVLAVSRLTSHADPRLLAGGYIFHSVFHGRARYLGGDLYSHTP